MKRIQPQHLTEPGRTGDSSTFTGAVEITSFFQTAGAQRLSVNVVAFSAGARTHWHSHAGGQILHVVSGEGATQERGGKVQRLAAGDLVSVEPGTWHWHGSGGDHALTHVAFSLGDADWGEPVDI